MRSVLRHSGRSLTWSAALSFILVLLAAAAVWATPTVTATTPVDGSSGVSVGTSVQAAFSEAMDASVVDTRHVTLARQVKVIAISAGSSHALAVRNDGTVASWRYSGDYNDVRDSIPAGLTGVTAVAAGDYHSLALKNDGTVVAWGQNTSGQANVPANLAGVVAVAAGRYHSVALKNDGTVVAWGSNAIVPAGLSGIKAVAACGDYTLALKSDGTVTGWGLDGTYTSYKSGSGTIPTTLNGVAGIAQGWMHGLAVKCDGTVVAWGNNGYGQSAVPAGLSGVKSVAAGHFFSLALKNDGTVVSWGKDSTGHLISVVPTGLSGVVAISAGESFSIALKDDCTVAAWGGTSTVFPAPASPMVPDEPGEVVSIAQGGSFGLALRRDGTVGSWGNNSYGQGTPPAGLTGVKAVAAGFYHSVALKSDGTVAAWGDNRYGQTSVPSSATGVKAITAGTYHTVALRNDGTVIAWGKNDKGQINVPSGLSGVIAIVSQADHTAAIKSDGTVVAWGNNASGQCNVPAGLSGVKAIATGSDHTIALKNDGTIVGWGNNSYGQGAAPTPPLTGVIDLTAGQAFSAALLSDGTVFSWGALSPMGSASTMPAGLNGVRKIAGNWADIAVVKSNNTVVAWGSDNYGQTDVTFPYRNANIYENPVFGMVSYDAAARTATLTPLSPLDSGSYVAEVTTVRNAAGAPIASPVLWRFTTDGYDPGTVCPCFTQVTAPTCTSSVTYKITGTVAGNTGGTISCVSPVASGANSTCTITAATGYQLTALTDNSASVFSKVSNNSYTISNVQADHAVIATFADVIPPVLPILPDFILEATSAAGATANFTVKATDNVDPNPVVTCTPASGSTFALGATTVTCTARDASGNTSTGTFTVTVKDTTPPVLTVPADKTVEATGPLTTVAIGTATATDLFMPVTITNNAPANSSYGIGTTTVTWTAKDANSNQSSSDQHITVQDTTAPVVTPPANVIVEATGPLTYIAAKAIGTATATDAVGVTSITSNFAEKEYPLGPISVVWTARDAANNAGTGNQTVTVVDTTPPAVTVPTTPVVAEAASAAGAPVFFNATATDLVDQSPALSCSAASGSIFPIGETTVTCTATDYSKNSASKTFIVKVQDTTPPSVTPPADLSIEATGPLTHIAAKVIGTATATDAVGVTSITSNFAEGDYPLGPISVLWTAKDAANNAGTGKQTVSVVDTTPPTVTVPAEPVIAEATSPAGAPVSFNVTAIDLVDQAPTVSCSPASGSIFPIGDTTVTCIGADYSKNSASKTFTVKVQDTTAPVVTPPASSTIEATGPMTHVTAKMVGTATATDAVGVTSITSSFLEGDYPLGALPAIVWTAKDAAGNAGTAKESVNVVDTTAPTVTVPTSPVVAEATSPAGAPVSFNVSAIDLVDQAPAVSCFPASGSIFPLGETTVTCTGTDYSKNSASKTFIVKVQDTTPPVLAGLVNQTVEATSPAGAVAKFLVTASDRADAAPTVTCSAASGSTFAFGPTVITCTAKDASNNTATGSFTINVQDTTPPALTVPKDITVILNTPLSAPAVQAFLNGATAIDAASPPATITATTPVLTAVGDKVVTFTATDAIGNKTSGTATIHVIYGCGDTYTNNQAANFSTPVTLLKPFKQGSSIPVKLHLCDANGVDVTSATPRIYLQMYDGSVAEGDRITGTSTSAADTENYFRVAGNMYIYNLYTKSLNAGMYQIQAVLDDGTTRTIPLELKP